MIFNQLRAFGVVSALSVGMLAVAGCSDGDGGTASSASSTSTGDTSTSTSSGSGGAGGAATTTSTTGGGGQGGQGTGGSTGAGGEGGAGGSAPAYGPPATETVSAGQVSKSASYRMVYTLGQPSQNQGKMSSPNNRLQGGIIGATGSLP